MNPDKRMADPPGGWVLGRSPLLIGACRILVFEGVADAICQGGLPQEAHGHPHEQRHDALRFFEVNRRGEKLRVLQKAEPAFCRALPFVACQQLERRQMRVVEFVRRQEKTTVLVDARLAGRERRGQSPIDLVDQLRLNALSGASPFAIAGCRVHGAGGQARRLQALLEGRPRLPRLGFARKGRAA